MPGNLKVHFRREKYLATIATRLLNVTFLGLLRIYS